MKKRWKVAMTLESNAGLSAAHIKEDIIQRAIEDQEAGGMILTLRGVQVEEEELPLRARLLRELHMLVNPGEYGLGDEPESMSPLQWHKTCGPVADAVEVEAFLEQEKKAWERVGVIVDELLALEEKEQA